MKKSPLLWGILATAVYLLGLLTFLYSLGIYPEDGLSWNEIGDFFAGAFAPLAFVWLVVAVILQRAELEAQRKTLEQQMEELKLNREELILNREMLKEQAEELRLQSSALKRQVEVLDQNSLVTEITARLERVLHDTRSELGKYRWRRGNSHASAFDSHGTAITLHLQYDRFSEACEQAVKIANDISKQNCDLRGEVGSIINELNSIEDVISESKHLKSAFTNFPISELVSELRNLSNSKSEDKS